MTRRCCYVSIDWFHWFLNEIDPYKAVDNMWKWFLSFNNEKTQAECIKLLREYLKHHLDVSEIIKWRNKLKI